MNRALLITLCFLSILIVGTTTRAQGVPIGGGGIVLSASSDSPSPGQTVTITARSYSIDINSATITWTINGKVALKDVGATTMDIKAPALGKTMTINVSAVTLNKTTVASSISINSGSIDLIVESDGYVPTFFQGKVPVGYQNNVKIIAVPHLADSKGVEYDPKNLVYTWKKNSRVVEDQSGYGKQTLTLIGDIVPRAASITVTATTRDGALQTAGYISISYSSPSLTFYEDDPLYGPFFNSAVKNNLYIGTERETGVLAIPYGFNKPISGIGNMALTWSINGIEHPELSSNQSVTLRAPDESAGSSNVELSIRNSKQILQSANVGFTARFSAKSDSANTVNAVF